jgi:hypothetical protein
MHSTKLQRLSLIMVVGLVLSGVLACDPFGGGATKPTVTVSSPENLTEVQVGAEVEVVSTVRDTKGVTKVELAVDGVLFSTEASPSPQGDTSWTLTQTWVATEPGVHNLTVTAYNVDGLASDPWGIAVKVVEGAEPGATGTVTLATSTPAAPGATATLPPPGSTATTAPPAPTRTTAAPPPTNTPVPPPTNTPVPPPPGQPDLTISELSVDPANPAYGASGAAYFTIRNRGSAPAGPSVLYFQWGPGDGEVGQAQVPALAAGAEHSLGANVGPFYASFEVWGIIDAGSAVAESNEDNNRRTFMVNVAAPALPDLTIEELSLNPWPYWGNESDARITVANYGSGDAGSFTLYYWWAETERCEFRMDPLPAGAEVTKSCHVGPFWSSFNTYAMADVLSEVAESTDDNNRRDLYVEAG